MRREGKKDPRLDSRVNHTDPFSFHTFDSAAAGRGIKRWREKEREIGNCVFFQSSWNCRALLILMCARERERETVLLDPLAFPFLEAPHYISISARAEKMADYFQGDLKSK